MKRKGNRQVGAEKLTESGGGQTLSLHLYYPSMGYPCRILLDEPFTQTRNFGLEFGFFGFCFQLQPLQPFPHV